MTPQQEKEIAQLESIINNPKTTDEQKEKFRGIIEKIKAKGKDAPEPKAEPKEATPKDKKEKVESVKTKADTEYDCDKLIAELKAKKAKSRRAAKERAEAPVKKESTKAIEKMEKIESTVIKKVESGKMPKAELIKIIKETKDLLKSLEKQLSEL